VIEEGRAGKRFPPVVVSLSDPLGRPAHQSGAAVYRPSAPARRRWGRARGPHSRAASRSPLRSRSVGARRTTATAGSAVDPPTAPAADRVEGRHRRRSDRCGPTLSLQGDCSHFPAAAVGDPLFESVWTRLSRSS